MTGDIMKKFRKIYIEISNICNLSCRFCPGTRRDKKRMTAEEFALLLPKLQPYTDYLYFHIMGEPLCHPDLDTFLSNAGEAGFRVILTTNGTLLSQKLATLQTAASLHKINISLHAFEANDLSIPFSQYLQSCFDFGQRMQGKAIVCYRLWNNGGSDQRNEEILDSMHRAFPGQWIQEHRGIRIGERIYLEYGDKFDWPDLQANDYGSNVFCQALRDQIGILCDGTVVPCCLDHEGDIPLGNLLTQNMDEILNSPRAKAIYHGFSQRKAAEELCRHCGYAQRFGK